MASLQPLVQSNIPAAGEIYAPLNPRNIRILTLLPGKPGDALHCRLEVSSLDANPDYEALSYVWGSQDDPAAISLGGRPYHVTPNLAAALRQLRSETAGRRLWVDAVCIDQSNPAERGEQVRQMHVIFAGAREVVGWLGVLDDPLLSYLGVSGEETGWFLAIVREAEARRFDVSWMRGMLRENAGRLFNPLRGLLVREYWRRLWVVQEIVHAKRVRLMCGSTSIVMGSLVRFLNAIFWATFDTPDEEIRVAALKGVELFTLYFTPLQDHLSAMKHIVYLGNNKRCRDLRDKLFGVRSLLPEELQECIDVDYSASVGDVYASATRKIIESVGALDGILWRPFQWDQTELCGDLDIPTWAISLIEENNMPTSECALGNTFRASAGFPAFYSFSGRQLETRGVRIGVIRQSRMNNLGRDQRMAFRFSDFIKHSRSWLEKIRWPCAAADIDRRTYAMTLLCGGWPELVERVERNVFGEMDELDDIQDRRLGEMLLPLAEREAMIFEPTRAGLLSGPYAEEGTTFKYMGLTSNRWVFEGDVVCVLLGFKTPVILKPVGDKYELIGDAYIRIYMDGEAMAGFSGDVDELESFTLI